MLAWGILAEGPFCPSQLDFGPRLTMIALMEHTAHSHGEAPTRGRLLSVLVVTGTIMVAEVIGGFWAGSLALLADAGHMLTDFLALVVTFTAMALGARPRDPRRTYGYRRLEILAALINGVALVVISGSIFYEAVQRWMSPRHVHVGTMGVIAVIGLLANILGLYLLGHDRENLNVRGAFLHILGDTLSSVGVAVAAVVIYFTGWTRLDAVLSCAIALVIVITSVTLLREVFDVLLEAAPRGIDTERVRKTIGEVAGVEQVHDLHVWTIASGLPALSAHVVVSDPLKDVHDVLMTIQMRLRHEYAIDHSTLQIERRAEDHCGSCV